MWFAWKIVPLWYQQQPHKLCLAQQHRCDLLEKLYLCGINNNNWVFILVTVPVVICLKNCTFVVSTTTLSLRKHFLNLLWFAWKIAPPRYQQQQFAFIYFHKESCDLLEKLYLCGINNNYCISLTQPFSVVICLKNCTFVVSTTTWVCVK